MLDKNDEAIIVRAILKAVLIMLVVGGVGYVALGLAFGWI